MAKTNKINLKGKRKKKEIIDIMQLFLKKKVRKSRMNMLCSYFRIVKDKKKCLEISQWFRESRVQLGGNRLSRFLNCKKVTSKIVQICEKERLQPCEVVYETRHGIFTKPSLALLAVLYLSNKLLDAPSKNKLK